MPEQIQDSVYQFEFGIKNNPDRYKNMKSKVAVLVSQLIEGTPWKEEEYISPEELLRREKEKKLQEFIDSFNQPKFSEWFSALSEEEREEITPGAIKQQPSYEILGVKLQLQKEQAKLYFDRHIWPGIEKEFKELS